MNIVFFGTSDFAMPSLGALIASPHRVLAVVTQPDRKKGRRLILSPPPVKVLAAAHAIDVYQPADASATEAAGYLTSLGAEAFVVVSFGQILKKDILSIPKRCALNLHGSLLPKYRGAAPTNWAIITGDRSSGVTVIRMNERMDEGDILLKREIAIDREDTNITLSEKLSEAGAKALLEAIDLIGSGAAVFQEQDGRQATYAPKLKKEDALIDWGEPAERIHNKVRGYIPWPGAHTYHKGKMVKLWKTRIADMSKARALPGEVIGIARDTGIVVRTGGGSLAIQYLQIEGKKILDASSFLRGRRIAEGEVLGDILRNPLRTRRVML